MSTGEERRGEKEKGDQEEKNIPMDEVAQLTGLDSLPSDIQIDEDDSTTTLHNCELDLYTLPGFTKRDYIIVIYSCNDLLLFQAFSATDKDPDAGKEDLRLFVCNPDIQGCRYNRNNVGSGNPRQIRNHCLYFRQLWTFTLEADIGYQWEIDLDGVYEGRGPCLVSLDLNKELVRWISLPPSTTPHRPNALYEINGCLYSVFNVHNVEYGSRFEECVEIWALRSYDAMDCRWVKEHVVSMDPILLAVHEVPRTFRGGTVLDITNFGSTSDGKKLMFHLDKCEKLVSYDLQSRQVMLIQLGEEDGLTFRYARSFGEWSSHASSLVSCL
ncbi:hypothetical protein Ancab_037860 [Ancistrocladus abbreviatus]